MAQETRREKEEELLGLYLDARYWCEAARQAHRGTRWAREMASALRELCVELRSLLPRGGTVARKFPRELLELPPGERLRGCREAATVLAERGSTAAKRLLALAARAPEA